MMIARWTIEARFGRKQAALDLMRRWWREVAPAIGWSASQARILSGSLGARESSIEVEIAVGGLGDIEAAWARLGAEPAQQRWADDLEPLVVSGSARWTVYRTVAVTQPTPEAAAVS